MRDVPEDWRLGRVYLPQDELARFEVTEEDIAAGRTGPAWRALMDHQAERADALLAEGLGLLPLLDRRSRLGVRAFAGVYAGCSARCGRRATTSSRTARAFPAPPSCAPSWGSDEGRRGGRGAGRDGGRARPRRRGPRGHAARGAPGARRRGAHASGAGGRSAAAARQRPAHLARLLHRVPGLPRADRTGRLGPAHAARAAGDRGERARLAHQSRRIRAHALPARGPARPDRDRARGARRRPAGARGARRRDVRRTAALARLLGRGDRAVLGRLHPARAQPALRGGERGARDLHRPYGAPRGRRRERPGAPDVSARRDARGRGGERAPRRRGRRAHEGRVTALDGRTAVLADGERIEADGIVVALPRPRAPSSSRNRSRRSRTRRS